MSGEIGEGFIKTDPYEILENKIFNFVFVEKLNLLFFLEKKRA